MYEMPIPINITVTRFVIDKSNTNQITVYF